MVQAASRVAALLRGLPPPVAWAVRAGSPPPAATAPPAASLAAGGLAPRPPPPRRRPPRWPLLRAAARSPRIQPQRRLGPLPTVLPRAGTAGFWDGQPGESGWHPTSLAVRQVTGGAPVPFADGYPDFSSWSRGHVTFPAGSLDGSRRDARQADRNLTAFFWQRRLLPAAGAGAAASAELALDGRAYRRRHDLDWHHERDGRTLTLLERRLHQNVPHRGGAVILRRGRP